MTLWEHDPSDERAEAGVKYLLKNKRRVEVLEVGTREVRLRDLETGGNAILPTDSFERQIKERLA